MEQEQQKINLSISDGEAFYAHQASINFNPSMIFLDFKSITPRVDERSQTQATLVMKHNVVMMEPYHALLFKDLFEKVIKKYESEFGKIEKPNAIKILEKKGKAKKNSTPEKIETPSYLG
jgi:hypothetical protein